MVLCPENHSDVIVQRRQKERMPGSFGSFFATGSLEYVLGRMLYMFLIPALTGHF